MKTDRVKLNSKKEYLLEFCFVYKIKEELY